MMLVSRRSIFDLFDDFFDNGFLPQPPKKEKNLMRTDIREKKHKFIVDVDLPGFEKENIKLNFDNDYLKISAKINKESHNPEEERFVYRERFYGESSLIFSVGDNIKEEDISAEFKNGILKIEILKKNSKTRLKKLNKLKLNNKISLRLIFYFVFNFLLF